MMRRLLPVAAGVICLGQASAAVLTFEDLPGLGPVPHPLFGDLPSSYSGFHWDNWWYSTLEVWCGDFGNLNNLPSGDKYVQIMDGFGSAIVTAEDPFDFVGAYVMTCAEDNRFDSFSSGSLRVSGYRNGVLVGTHQDVLSCVDFAPFTANLKGVDTLVFDNGGVAGGHSWVLDDFIYEKAASVPGPAAVTAFTLGLLLRRKRR